VGNESKRYKIIVDDVSGAFPREEFEMEFLSEEELFDWVRREFSHVYNPKLVPKPTLFEPFEGWDGNDSEFGPYEITIIPLN